MQTQRCTWVGQLPTFRDAVPCSVPLLSIHLILTLSFSLFLSLSFSLSRSLFTPACSSSLGIYLPTYLPRKMHLKNSICAILLLTLSRVAFATLEYAADGQSGITKRAAILAAEGGFMRTSVPNNPSSRKRQTTCSPVTWVPCSKEHGGCCKFSLSLLNLNIVNNIAVYWQVPLRVVVQQPAMV